jgi:aerobic carbon-monoxide dehydrogenase medium subunit
MITQEIEFHAPRSVPEVLALLAEHGEEAKILGGGMSLLPTMNLGLARPEILISLNHVDELAYIRDDGQELRIGARTRHAEVVSDPLVAAHAPILAEAAKVIGDVQVRNRGTVGGSIAHADPAADYLPVLAVLRASIVVRSAAGERAVPATDFFVDIMMTALEPDELVAEVRVPKLGPGSGGAYRRLSRVEGSFAIVNAAALVGPGVVRVAIGGIAARPVVVDLTAVTGGTINAGTLDAIGSEVRTACPEPYSDLNGDAEYRREMAVVYARRAVEAAAERAAA